MTGREGAVDLRRHRRPGTAVRAKGRQRSEQILDAATRILVEEGYAQLSTRKIASRAGIRPGNLQYYYPAKDDVVRALLERWLARSMRAIEARIAATARTPEAALRAGVNGILADQADAGACQMFWEIWALAARDQTVARTTRAFYHRYRDGLAGMLLAVNPCLGRARAARRATLAVALLEGLTVFRLGGGGSARGAPELVRELQAFLLHLAKVTDT
jgi:AcrR family transcriptional regulator